MFKTTGKFKFGNMPFIYEILSDKTFSENELFIAGDNSLAKKALECDHFNDAIYSYVRRTFMDEFWFGNPNLDAKRRDAADNCFGMADFGSMVVEETGGWEYDNCADEWKRIAYVSSGGDDPTTRVRFKVVFESHSDKILAHEIIY